MFTLSSVNKKNKMKNKKIKTTVCAAFCGCGKTYLCEFDPVKYKEIECWNYRKGNFPSNYVQDIKKQLGKSQYLFISSDPVILNYLHKEGVKILLVYPENTLKEEYMQRYCNRNSGYDFIGVMYKHWHEWVENLTKQTYCKHIILKKGQTLKDVLK